VWNQRKELEMSEPHTQISVGRHLSDRSLRAADRDREAVADILREQHLAGRLDTDEPQERLGRCYAAKTYAELDSVLAELPAAVPEPVPSERGGLHRHGGDVGRYPFGPRALPMPVLVPLLLVALALSHGHLVWLALPFVFLFVARRWRWRSNI
jgi:hypothetical protein